MMRSFFCCLVLLPLVLFPGAVSAQSPDQSAEGKTLCSVCRVHEGETEAEAVAATAEYQGETFGFCSADCKAAFLEDPEAYLPPVFPRPAPGFRVLDLEGEDFASSALEGRWVLLDFWATWCQPCVQDLPRLTRLHESLEKEGLTVVSVSIDEGKNATRKVSRMIRKRGATHPVFLDREEDSAWAAYRVKVVPAQFLIDDQGRIVAQWSGKVDLQQVEGEIRRRMEMDRAGG